MQDLVVFEKKRGQNDEFCRIWTKLKSNFKLTVLEDYLELRAQIWCAIWSGGEFSVFIHLTEGSQGPGPVTEEFGIRVWVDRSRIRLGLNPRALDRSRIRLKGLN